MTIQGTDEWIKARLGKATGSRMTDILAKNKSKGYSATRKNYMAEKIVERLTGEPIEGKFYSKSMDWGGEKEVFAKIEYTSRTFNNVMDCGFIDHPKIENFGSSPDGLVGDDGCIEIKCPDTAQHLDMLESGTIDRKYRYQMQSEMMCAERKWCDYVSFDPRLPERLQIFIKHIEIDMEMVLEIETEVIKFLCELDEKILKLENILW